MIGRATQKPKSRDIEVKVWVSDDLTFVDILTFRREKVLATFAKCDGLSTVGELSGKRDTGSTATNNTHIITI